MSARITLLLTIVATLALDARESAAAPVVAAGDTPLSVLGPLFHAIQKGDVDTALSFTAEADERTRARSRELLTGLRGRPAKWNEIVAHLQVRDAAVAIVRERALGKINIDLDPIYLVRQDGVWRVMPALSDPDARGVDLRDGTRRRLEIAASWYREQKTALKRQIAIIDDPRVFTIEAIRDARSIRKKLASGLDPDVRNWQRTNHDYLITFAVRWDAADTVRVLLDAGAFVDIRSVGTDKTPLFQAAYEGHLDIVRLLVERGADVNALDMFGSNVLREAIVANHPGVITYLLGAGADPDRRNEDGSTMRDLAAQHGSPAVKAAMKAGG